MTKIPHDLRSWQFNAGIALLVVFILLSLGAITSQSLWIDEANGALKAIQPTWSNFWDVMLKEKGSDMQMPGYLLALWGWEKLVGSSEWALRSLNIVWLTLGLWAFLFRLQQPVGVRVAVASITALSAFTWAYLDEARPYAMQIGSSSLIAVALANLCLPPSSPVVTNQRRNIDLAACGAILLSASSLIGAFFCGFFGMAFVSLWLLQDRKLLVARTKPVVVTTIFTVILLMGLGGYYLWTLKQGAGASDLGKTGVENVIFSVYELSGLAGLGPGRLEIRENGLKAFTPFIFMLFSCGSIVGATVIAGCLCGFRRLRLTDVLLAAFLLISAASVFLVGYIAGFRVVGRHLTPLFPFLSMTCAGCLYWLFLKNKTLCFALTSLFFVVLLASSINQRFHPRFAKDDYRSACQMAKSALEKEKVIWWAADGSAPKYYGVLPYSGKGRIIMVKDKTCEQLLNYPSPQMVILSKPDVYDVHGAIRQVIGKSAMSQIASFPAFTVWDAQHLH